MSKITKKEILQQIEQFGDGEKLSLCLIMVADACDGNLTENEWNFIMDSTTIENKNQKHRSRC